jgi:lysozyme family protein
MAWGAGPKQAIKLLQRMIAAGDDGDIGPFTAKAYRDFLANHALVDVAARYAAARNAFYDLIIANRPSNAKYRNGWRNRTASFLPTSPWWTRFAS